MTDIEEQIAQVIFNRSHQPDDPLDLPDSQVNALAVAVMPLVKRAQAEALREAAEALDASAAGLDPERSIDISYINCTHIDANELRRRADEIEKEAGA